MLLMLNSVLRIETYQKACICMQVPIRKQTPFKETKKKQSAATNDEGRFVKEFRYQCELGVRLFGLWISLARFPENTFQSKVLM